MDFDYQPLVRAIGALELALKLHDMAASDAADLRLTLRSACIKNFEVAYELGWKSQRRWLITTQDAERVENLYSRADLFRMAAQCGVIADPESWIVFHHARNHGAHVYQEEVAQRSFLGRSRLCAGGKAARRLLCCAPCLIWKRRTEQSCLIFLRAIFPNIRLMRSAPASRETLANLATSMWRCLGQGLFRRSEWTRFAPICLCQRCLSLSMWSTCRQRPPRGVHVLSRV